MFEKNAWIDNFEQGGIDFFPKSELYLEFQRLNLTFVPIENILMELQHSGGDGGHLDWVEILTVRTDSIELDHKESLILFSVEIQKSTQHGFKQWFLK